MLLSCLSSFVGEAGRGETWFFEAPASTGDFPQPKHFRPSLPGIKAGIGERAYDTLVLYRPE
jgi:hypothetical protein